MRAVNEAGGTEPEAAGRFRLIQGERQVMYNADQLITLLRQADQNRNAEVRAAYTTLMGQLAAHLVGEPLADGEVSDAEWVLLQHSLRRFSASPRSAAAWAVMRKQAAVLESTLQQAAAAQTAASNAPREPETSRLPGLRPRWLQILSRNRGPQQVNRVEQHIGAISQSQGVTIIGQQNQTASVLAMDDDAPDDETAPAETAAEIRPDGIFLSYSRKDASTMRRLRADLRAEGFAVWTDESLTLGTPSWLEAVENAIRTALCVIVLLTPDAKKSEWVERELSMAKLHRKQIIPLLSKGEERSSLPLLLANAQYADIRTETNYKARMRDLRRLLVNLQRGARASV